MIKTLTRAQGISLRHLLPEARIAGADDIRAKSCCDDSRQTKPGDLFVALEGAEHDGHDFAREAVSRGATAILAERHLPVDGLPTCIVHDARDAYGRLCQALAGNPAASLKVIGVTGTNGKTATASLVAHMLMEAGHRPGILGSLGYCDGFDIAPATDTTPSPPVLAHWLARMAAGGCSHAVLEMTSRALVQSRAAGIEFDAAIVTDVGRDHLDYHGTLANYRNAKSRLLSQLSTEGVAVLNLDDPTCVEMLTHLHNPVLTVGLNSPAELTATVVERHLGEQTFLLTAGTETVPLRSKMIGDHHVVNCLSAAALGLVYGIDLPTVVRGIESAGQVPGHMESICCGQSFGVVVDHAQTNEGLAAALRALREVTEGRLICVFGAGGDRDRGKRPLMGRCAERMADQTIVTSDNPRSEDPESIAKQILAGFDSPARAQVVLDRAEAIQRALTMAAEGDCVLIAGRGHENYQAVGREHYFFDDRQLTRQLLYQMGEQQRTAA